jgi:hypothetical protein
MKYTPSEHWDKAEELLVEAERDALEGRFERAELSIGFAILHTRLANRLPTAIVHTDSGGDIRP